MRKTSYMQDMEENLIQMNCELILKVSHGTEERRSGRFSVSCLISMKMRMQLF